MPDIKFSNQYPYTDFHELNLDWVIKEVKYWSTKVGKTIQSIELTGTAGLVDTYTINYSDGTTSTFDVTNGYGIDSVTKTATVGLVDTYTISYSDGTTSTFDITNGNGIVSVAKTGTAGLVDTYTITFQDGSTTTFEVHNGTASIDPTLSLAGYAADAKATGDALAALGGFSDIAKNALLACLEKVAWIDGSAPTLIATLRSELFPLISINATFTQSGVIYDTDSLDVLKQYLVVVANYVGGTSRTLSDSEYTLSGTLTAGTSTITVSYQSFTDTFTVTVTANPETWTWIYNPGVDGILSDQAYATLGTHNGETEEVVGGLYHVLVPQNTVENSLQIRLGSGSGQTTGHIRIKVMFSSICLDAVNALWQSSGFRFQISCGGSKSAKLAVFKYNGDYGLYYISGNGNYGTRNLITTIALNTWYVFDVKMYDANSFEVFMDGVSVYSGSGWSTVVSTDNGIYSIAKANATPENLEYNIEYIKFLSGGTN